MKLYFADCNVLQIFTSDYYYKLLAVPEPESCLMERQPSLAEVACALDKTQDNSVLPFIELYVGKCITMVECNFPNCKIEIILSVYEFSFHNDMNC